MEVPVDVIEAAESAQLRATLKGHEDGVWQVAWSPDGKTLASLSSAKGEVKLWDVGGRVERTTLQGGPGASYSLAFTPDGKTLAVALIQNDASTGPSGGIALWDVAAGKRKGLLQHTPPRGVARLALAPDGKTAAALEDWKEGKEGEKAAYKACITLWDIAAGKPAGKLADESPGALAFSPDGNVLAWSAYVVKDRTIVDAPIRRRDLKKQQDLPELRNPAGKDPLSCLAFSPDGRALAGADFAGHLILWDTATGKVLATLSQENLRQVRSLAFSPDGKTLAAAVGDRRGRGREPGLIVLWDAATGQRLASLTGHTNAVLSVAFSPDGKLLASGSLDGTVRLWDVTSPPATRGAGGGR